MAAGMALASRAGMGIDALAKRYYPLVVCLMLAVAAYFQAFGMSHLLGVVVAPSGPPSRADRPDARVVVTHPSDRDLSATAILERNPFDSVTGPLTAQEMHPPALEASSSADPYDDPPCDIARAVLIASADDPAWSFAAIMGPDGKTALHRSGDDFYGGKVDFVGDRRLSDERARDDHAVWDRVWLVGPNGQRCQLQLGAKPPAKMAAPGSMPAPPPPGGGLPKDLVGKIRQIGEHEFDVDRSAVEALVANPADLMKTRVVPEKEGDRVVGLKLFGIRPNTLLGTLGLQNGDRLVSLNGFEMNDPQKMLEAYSKLMRADHLSASIVRGGKPVNIEFNIK
jgi:general secretion pathway protein C